MYFLHLLSFLSGVHCLLNSFLLYLFGNNIYSLFFKLLISVLEPPKYFLHFYRNTWIGGVRFCSCFLYIFTFLSLFFNFSSRSASTSSSTWAPTPIWSSGGWSVVIWSWHVFYIILSVRLKIIPMLFHVLKFCENSLNSCLDLFHMNICIRL